MTLIMILAALTLAVAAVAYAYIIEAREVTVQHAVLRTASIRGSVKIALVSDLHLYRKRFVDREKEIGHAIVRTVLRERPDALLLAGDLIDHNGGIPALDRVLKAVRSVGPAVTCAVLGNHDHYQYNFFHLFSPLFDFIDKKGSDVAALRKVLRNNGVRLLTDEKVLLRLKGNRIWLAGADYLAFKRKKIPSFHFTERDKSFKILLSHYPDVVRLKGKEWERFDLVLSGHTHGGQVTFFGYPLMARSRIGRKNLRGASVHNNTVLYITKGVGVSRFVPIRFFAKPDITIIRLEGNNEKK